MDWFGVLRYVALMIFVGSVWGCSQQEGATPGTGRRTESSMTGNTVAVDATVEPGELRADLAALDETAAQDDVVQPTRDVPSIETPGDVVAGQAVGDNSVAQTSAIQLQPGPAMETQVAAPPTQIDIPSSIAPVASSDTIAGDNGTTASVQTDVIVAGPAGARRNGQPTVQGDVGAVHKPLFVNWPEPSMVLLLTGRQHGYMEPCGCSGLDSQNGGLVRRGTLIQQLTDKGWPVIPIDAGNQVRRFGRQAEIKLQFTVESLRTMGYQAIGFGPDDLRLPGPELVGLIKPDEETPSLFVSANVEVFASSYTSAYRVLEAGGKKIGITAVVGARNQKLIHNDDLTMRSAEAGLKQVWPGLEQARCDLYVLIAHATIEESIALGKMFPQFKLVVTTGGAGEPTQQPERIQGTESQMVQVGTKGMFAGVVGLFDDPARPLRYQRIPLDSRFPDSRPLLQLLAAYQDQLKMAGFEGLGIRPQPLAGDRKFVGSEICKDCHDDEYKTWAKGRDGHEAKHAHAYATLQHPPNSRGGIPRNFDPECISCHVVGWNPQQHFPYESGFWSLEKTPELINVGCENCHGPGSKHVAAEKGDLDVGDDEMDAIREQMWLALKDAEQTCIECHDLDNSPAFLEEGAFERYWKKIKH